MDTRLTLLEAPADAEESCYIDTPLGVVSVLNAIAASGARAAAYMDGGETFVLTTFLAVEDKPPQLVFERGPDEALNERLLETENITFVTSDQGVPVQFTCAGPSAVSHEGMDAFRIPVPPRVLRLQRRMYYRLPGEPVHVQLKFEMPCGELEGEPKILKPAILDLSCGGLAAAVPVEEPMLEIGTRAPCLLELPALGRIDALVQVRGTAEIVLPDGRESRRYGLEFVNINSKGVALIQRFILEQQRARKKVAV